MGGRCVISCFNDTYHLSGMVSELRNGLLHPVRIAHGSNFNSLHVKRQSLAKRVQVPKYTGIRSLIPYLYWLLEPSKIILGWVLQLCGLSLQAVTEAHIFHLLESIASCLPILHARRARRSTELRMKILGVWFPTKSSAAELKVFVVKRCTED